MKTHITNIIREFRKIVEVLSVDPETSYSFSDERDTITSQLYFIGQTQDFIIYVISNDVYVYLSECYNMKAVTWKIRNHFRKKRSERIVLKKKIIEKLSTLGDENLFDIINTDNNINLILNLLIRTSEITCVENFTLSLNDCRIEIDIPNYKILTISI